ncbi:MAG: outer membrane lipid asymmetry maintenance protein MlaD [Holosporales bacterium]|jgi:phospholipid/cholesterol/gamma-HCH transport system substrate-binding protein|nr:outer membrane lipid asymmetry maintenance protein MlaD [Holosporales bacterium]
MDRIFETLVGFFVLGTAGAFFLFAYTHTAGEGAAGYTLSASFDAIDGIGVGSDVKIGGVKVGSVRKISLLPESYLVSVVMQLTPSIKVPRDTTAAIVSEGLIGGKFVSLVPGGDDVFLKEGETLIHTQGSVSLEGLIGKMMFSSGTK